MIVKSLNWISETAREAQLVISDGKNECLAFSHPCNFKEGEVFSGILSSFITKNLMIAPYRQTSIKMMSEDNFEHQCIAEVVNSQENLVRIGDIFISLDQPLPKDIKDGDIVEFLCMRLDT